MDTFENMIQREVPELLNKISKHPTFKMYTLDQQVDFLTNIVNSFNDQLNIELKNVCDDFEEIFDAWEAQDEMSIMLKKAAELEQKRKKKKRVKFNDIKNIQRDYKNNDNW